MTFFCVWVRAKSRLNISHSVSLMFMYRGAIKVGISRYANLRIMSTDKWTTSESIQLSTNIWFKLLLLLENALKLNFDAL